MGLVNAINNIPITMMNFTSSIFSSGLNTSSLVSAEYLEASVGNGLLTVLYQILYFVAKWILYVIDVLFAFIRQLSGLEMKFDSLESLVSKESDFVFNLLLSGVDLITPIIKNLIGIAVTLIIFFSILAIVKTQFNSLKNKTPADVKGVLKDTMRAFVLLIITPMIAIVGIIASNLLLKTLYNATNTTNSNSVSTQLFSVSTSSASTYRTYAQMGQRIPITFDFEEHKEILEYYQEHALTDEFLDYVKSEKNLIYYMGYVMFKDGNFTTYDNLNDAALTDDETKQEVVNYYKIYDRTKESYNALEKEPSVDLYKRISSYEPEYYVMADVIDFGINTSSVTYFKTIEQVLDSVADVSESNQALFNTMVNRFQIEFLNNDLKKFVPSTRVSYNSSTEVRSENYSTYRDIYLNETWSVIRFTSVYYEADDESEPTRKMQIQYNHVRGATDEIDGAKFIMAFEQETKVDGVVYPYFYPLTVGQRVNGEYAFDSEFIQAGQIVSAKGVFSQSRYEYPVPTAIRISADGSEVQFYRHYIESVTLGETEDGLSGEITSNKESDNFFANLWNRIVALFNPKVNVNYDEDALITAYSYKEEKVNALPSGKLSISYMFEDFVSNIFGGAATAVATVVTKDSVEQIGLHGLNLKNVFIPSKINIFILLIGALLLVKIVFTAIFALINRSYELFLTIIVYPTACATIPIMDQDEGYKQWMKTYTQRLFATYGLILGLNFVMMLFPVIADLKVFTPEEVAASKILLRFRNLFFGISAGALADFLNLVVVILFQLTAFTLLETVPPIIQNITGASDLKGINPFEIAMKAVKVASAVITLPYNTFGAVKNFATTMFNDEKREQAIKNALKKAKGFIPGSAVVDHAKDFHHLQQKKSEQKEAMRELKDAMKYGEYSGKKDGDKTEQEKQSDAENSKNIQEKYEKLLKAQTEYSNAVSDPRKSREAADDIKRKNSKSGLDEDGKVSSKNDEDASDDIDLSHRTKRQLRREKSQAKKIVKTLEKKQKKASKGKATALTENEKAALEKNMKIVSNVEAAQKSKKDEKAGYKDAKKSLRELTKKRGENALTAQEEQQLAEAENKVAEHKGLGKKNRDARKQEREDRKEAAKTQKQAEKDEKENTKTERAFKNMDMGSKRIQKKFMKNYKNQTDKLQKQLDSAGFIGKNLQDMTPDELIEAQNASGTEEQKGIIKEYAKLTSNKDKMIGLTNDAMNKKAGVKTQLLEHKNRNKLGKRSGNRIQKKMLKKEQKLDDKLQDIQYKLSQIDPRDVSTMREYRKLKQEEQKIKSQQNFADYWAGEKNEDGVRTGGENNRDRKVLKQERKTRKKLEKIEGQVYEDRKERGLSTDPETVRRIAEKNMNKKGFFGRIAARFKKKN